jgi:hypothetical protein
MSNRNNRTDWLNDWVDQNTYENDCDGGQHAVEQSMEQELYEHYKSVIEIQSHTPDTNTGEGYYVKYKFDGEDKVLGYVSLGEFGAKATPTELLDNLAKHHLTNATYTNK